MLSRNTKKSIVKFISNTFADLMSESDRCQVSNYLIGFHAIVSILLIGSFFVFRNKYWQLFIIFGCLLVILSNFIFDGCLMTMVERDLCPNRSTVLDWELELIGVEVNNRNRRYITMANFVILFLVFVGTFYYLHIYKK